MCLSGWTETELPGTLAGPSEAYLPISPTTGPDLLPGVSLTVVSLPGCECKFSQPGSHTSCHPSWPWIWVRAWFCFPELGPALLCQSDSLRNLSTATPCSRHCLGGLQNPVCGSHCTDSIWRCSTDTSQKDSSRDETLPPPQACHLQSWLKVTQK